MNRHTNYLLAVVFLFLIAHPLSSQVDIGLNHTLAVIPLSTSFKQDEDFADYSQMLTETILTSVVQSQRFMMVDYTDIEKTVKVLKEQEKNSELYADWKEDELSDAHLVTIGKRLGIEYIFTGTITNVAVTVTLSGLYRAEFGFTLKVISVESGRIYVTESFAIGGGRKMMKKFGGENSKREALNQALQQVDGPIKVFIDKYFPIEAPFYKIKSENRKKIPTQIVIKGGLTHGLRNGQTLDVILKEKDDENMLYRDKIGEVKILEIESLFATCKVLKGGSEIKKWATEKKENLFVQSRSYEKKNLLNLK